MRHSFRWGQKMFLIFEANQWNLLNGIYLYCTPCAERSFFKQEEQNVKSQNDTFFFLHADMVTYLCCLTKRTSEPKHSKHTVLYMFMQCREPECNERDILMAFHLFMHWKWRGRVTFWKSWQNIEPTLGKWLYLWFHSDRWRYQERDRVTHLWQFKVLNDVMNGNIPEHSL